MRHADIADAHQSGHFKPVGGLAPQAGCRRPGLPRPPAVADTATARPDHDKPPSIQIGMLVACDPLGATQATSELRSRYLSLPASPPVMVLVSAVSNIRQGASWRPYGGHGRINLEAALTGAEEAEAPTSSALLLLPEVGMSQFGRDSRYAELVLDIEPRGADGGPASAMILGAWHQLFVQALSLPGQLAEFLSGDLGLATADDPPVQLGVWLKTPRAMTELIDIGGLTPIPGSPASNWFVGYAIADPSGHGAKAVAVELLRQMCDYTLHLDGYESALESLAG